MKLISADISSFGGIENYKIDFNDSLTVILEKNGWGKSTLAAFIKAMFYGLPVTKQQDLLKNERKRFTPWSGKTFGGSLTFDHNGKIYRIERSFDPKSSRNDTFRLYDPESGKVSADYDENIGQKLFGINGAAFARSVFISQNGTSSPDTDGVKSITAQLNGIAEEPADLSRYDAAMKKLEERRRVYMASGNRGMIVTLEGKIRDAEKELDGFREDEKSASELKEKAAAMREELSDLQKEQSALDEKIKLSVKMRQIRQNRELLEREEKKLEKARLENGALTEFFKNGVPDREEIDELEEALAGIPTLEKSIKASENDVCERADALAKRFSKYKPSDNEINGVINELSYASQAVLDVKGMSGAEKAELLELENVFSSGQPDSGELDSVTRKVIELETLEKRISESEKKDEESVSERKRALVPAIISLLFAVCGIALIFVLQALGIALLAVGIVGLLFSAFLYFRGYINERTSFASERAANESDMREAEKLKSSIDIFISRYRFGNEGDASEAVGLIKQKSVRYSELKRLEAKEELDRSEAEKRFEKARESERLLKEKTGTHDDLQTVADELKSLEQLSPIAARIRADAAEATAEKAKINERADKFLSRYPVSGDGLPALRSIKEKLRELSLSEKELAECEKNVSYAKGLCESDPGDITEDVGEPEALEKEKSELSERILLLSGDLTRAESRIEVLTESADGIPAAEEGLEELRRELELCRYRLNVITTAGEALEKAKENLSVRYLGDIRRNFARYASDLAPELLDGCEIDSGFGISRREGGMTRGIDYYSSGTKDMMNLCGELAVSDALFGNDECFLILDDPFVNLDGVRLSKMKEIINGLAEKRQIIYLTCHESRML